MAGRSEPVEEMEEERNPPRDLEWLRESLRLTEEILTLPPAEMLHNDSK